MAKKAFLDDRIRFFVEKPYHSLKNDDKQGRFFFGLIAGLLFATPFAINGCSGKLQ
jgi:hypothetical protein